MALMFALVGVYILYSWYDERLKAQIAEKDALIVQLSDRTKETEARRLAAEEGWNACRAEIDRLKEHFQSEKRHLSDQIQMLEQIKIGLGQDIEGIKAAHAAVLADERRKTAEVMAEKERLIQARNQIQSELEAERDKVKALTSDLARVNEAIAAAATSHQRRIAELERHLNERVSLARTTPEDAEVLRLIQGLGLLGTPEGRTAEAQALADELVAVKAELETLSKAHEAVRAQLAESQTELQRMRMELELNQRQVAQSTQARESLTGKVAALTAELEAERAARATLQQEHERAVNAHEAKLAEREQQLAELRAVLETARAESDDKVREAEKLAAAETRIQELEAERRALRAEAKDLQTRLNEALEQARARLAAPQQGAEAATQDESQALSEARERIAVLESELERARQWPKAERPSGDQCADAAELARLRDLYTEFAQLRGTFTERGLLLNLSESELRFPPGQATLPAGELVSLDRIAALLRAHPELSARIEGHTDSLGGTALNQALSLKRAQAVREALIERGVDEGRVSAEGLGPVRPIADNATAEGRGKNRRVEAYILEHD